jgi:hypothetical protein
MLMDRRACHVTKKNQLSREVVLQQPKSLRNSITQQVRAQQSRRRPKPIEN